MRRRLLCESVFVANVHVTVCSECGYLDRGFCKMPNGNVVCTEGIEKRKWHILLRTDQDSRAFMEREDVRERRFYNAIFSLFRSGMCLQ